MNVFYYPAASSKIADFCLEALRKDHNLQTIIALPGGCRLNHFLTLELRSGDILILFAANDAELDELLDISKEFEDFLVLLIIQESCDDDCRQKTNLLTPRFVTSLEDMQELTAVINNILYCDNNRSTLDKN